MTMVSALPLDITSALISIPLGIFTNIAADKLSAFIEKNRYIAKGLDDLFVNTFLLTIKEHNKHYDDSAKKRLNKLAKAIKRNKSDFLVLFFGDTTILRLNEETYIQKLSLALSSKFKVSSNDNLITSLIKDCLQDYKRCFFALITEKEFMGIVLEELFQGHKKIDTVLDILAKVDEKASVVDFYSVRENIFKYCENTDDNYRKELEAYDGYIQIQYRDLQLRGFTPHIGSNAVAMHLEDIFVPLEINSENSGEVCTNVPIINNKIPESLLRYHRSVLLGKPGSGKSTLLKHIAVSISKNRQQNETFGHSVPIFFKLSEYADTYKLKRTNLHDFLCNRIETRFRAFIDMTLKYSNAVILIDGLDEVSDKALRIKVAERIEEFVETYPRCQCIVSSRIVGYNEARLEHSFAHFKLEDFDKHQISQFSKNWTRAIHIDWDNEAITKEANELYESISRNNSVMKLATNPLLMTIIAMIYFKGRRLPNSRIALYEYSTETFLESWVRLRVDSDSKLKSKDEIIEILCPIAYFIHKEKSNECIGQNELIQKFEMYYKLFHTSASNETARKETREFIDFLREQTGFFYEVGVSEYGENLFSFMHLTFQEYFAGMYIANDFNDGGNLWKSLVYQSRWTEILRLAASHLSSHMSRKKTTDFLEAISNFTDGFPELGRKEQLLCLLFSDDITVSDNCKNQFFTLTLNYLSSEWSKYDEYYSYRTNSDYIDSIIRSNIGREFWEKCLSKVRNMDVSKCNQGVLLDILCNSHISKIDGASDQLLQLLNEAAPNLLKQIIKVSNIYSNKTLAIFNMAIEKYLDSIIDWSYEDWEILIGYFFRLGPSNIKKANFIDNAIKRHKSDSFIYNNLCSLLLATAILFGDYETYEEIVHKYITNGTHNYVNEWKNYYQLGDNGFTNIQYTNGQIYVVHISFYQGKAFISLFNSNELKLLHFDYPEQEQIFNELPDGVKKLIHSSIYIENFGENKNKEIFDFFSDSENPSRCWENFLLSHLNEKENLDSIFITYYAYYIRRISSKKYPQLNIPAIESFKYIPSPPIKAIIKINLGEYINNELLQDIRQYMLNSNDSIRSDVFAILRLSIADQPTDEGITKKGVPD